MEGDTEDPVWMKIVCVRASQQWRMIELHRKYFEKNTVLFLRLQWLIRECWNSCLFSTYFFSLSIPEASKLKSKIFSDPAVSVSLRQRCMCLTMSVYILRLVHCWWLNLALLGLEYNGFVLCISLDNDCFLRFPGFHWGLHQWQITRTI